MTSCARGVVPIIAGGTGLYIKTLIEGMAPVPEIDPDIRAMVRALPPAEAHARLAPLDPAAAAKLPASDRTRVQRALEVVLSSGRTLGEWQRETRGGIGGEVSLVAMMLLPPRDWLKARCDRRFDVMMAQGALAEVAALRARGLSADLPAMRAIGVPELAHHLAGELTLDAAVDLARIATRQYAKRQYTWLRGQMPGEWPREERALNDSIVNEIVIKLLQRLLTD
jgi:tRNA dimethylallyltransferase